MVDIADYSNKIKFGLGEQTDSFRNKYYGVSKDGTLYTASTMSSPNGKDIVFQAGSDIYLYVNFYTTPGLGTLWDGIPARVSLYGYNEPYKLGDAPSLLSYYDFAMASNSSFWLKTILQSKFKMPNNNLTVFYVIQVNATGGWVSLIESPGFPLYSTAATTPSTTTSSVVEKRCQLFTAGVGYSPIECLAGHPNGTVYMESPESGDLIVISSPSTTTSSATTTSSYVPQTGNLSVQSLTATPTKPTPGQKVTLKATVANTYNTGKIAYVKFYDGAGGGITKYASGVVPAGGVGSVTTIVDVPTSVMSGKSYTFCADVSETAYGATSVIFSDPIISGIL